MHYATGEDRSVDVIVTLKLLQRVFRVPRTTHQLYRTSYTL